MQTLTPEQLIKKAIVQRINEQNYDDFQQPIETGEEIDAAYDLAVEKRLHWDFVEEVRSGGIETNLPAPFSRHYEIDIHAQLIDNQWLAYPFYYGGGKHAEPSAIPWMEDAFFVDCEEEQLTITQRTFTKKN
jgi:hypothetical protein